MMIPNASGLLHRVTAKNDYGEPTFGPPITVRLAVCRLSHLAQQTSVRADTSATRGNAEETVAKGKVLLARTIKPAVDDKLECRDLELRITSVEDRHDVQGRLDHYEVIVELWDP